MSPEVNAVLLMLGSLLGFVAKRVPWINNNAIPFIILAFQYVGALLAAGGFLPTASVATASFVSASFVSTWINPFGQAIVNTAINVFLHQVQKAVRRLPWVYQTTTAAKKR